MPFPKNLSEGYVRKRPAIEAKIGDAKRPCETDEGHLAEGGKKRGLFTFQHVVLIMKAMIATGNSKALRSEFGIPGATVRKWQNYCEQSGLHELSSDCEIQTCVMSNCDCICPVESAKQGKETQGEILELLLFGHRPAPIEHSLPRGYCSREKLKRWRDALRESGLICGNPGTEREELVRGFVPKSFLQQGFGWPHLRQECAEARARLFLHGRFRRETREVRIENRQSKRYRWK